MFVSCMYECIRVIGIIVYVNICYDSHVPNPIILTEVKGNVLVIIGHSWVKRVDLDLQGRSHKQQELYLANTGLSNPATNHCFLVN